MVSHAAGYALASIFGFILIYFKLQEHIWLRTQHQRVHQSALSKKDKLEKLRQALPLKIWKTDNNNSIKVEPKSSRERENCLIVHGDEEDLSQAEFMEYNETELQDVDLDVKERSNECPICLLNFEDGCSTCYSNNPLCSHVFHHECMLEWLMQHEECPCCRAQYLTETV
mmetsp:Transcript_4544/g.5974  ORF Transcript_4544/g.5974 Transcript_4544/m.5974 type:complete len:170 (-) Transcript_4544:375-884(-)